MHAYNMLCSSPPLTPSTPVLPFPLLLHPLPISYVPFFNPLTHGVHLALPVSARAERLLELSQDSSLKKMGSPCLNSHQLSIVPQLGWDFLTVPHICEGILSALISCRPVLCTQSHLLSVYMYSFQVVSRKCWVLLVIHCLWLWFWLCL